MPQWLDFDTLSLMQNLPVLPIRPQHLRDHSFAVKKVTFNSLLLEVDPKLSKDTEVESPLCARKL